MSISNDYYEIAYNDFLFLSSSIDTELYNNISIQAQQVAEKLLKSVAEIVCPGVNNDIMHTHNLRAIYSEIFRVEKSFLLDESSLGLLKDLYFDAKYPGDNFVCVTKNTCKKCIRIMFNVIDEVNRFRENNGLPTKEFCNKKYEYIGVNLYEDSIFDRNMIAEYVGEENVDEFLKAIPEGITPDMDNIDLLIGLYRNKRNRH